MILKITFNYNMNKSGQTVRFCGEPIDARLTSLWSGL